LRCTILGWKSWQTASAVVMAIGGSTNAVLHLLALGQAAGDSLALEDFEAGRKRVPVLCDLKPSGRYVTTDLHRAGGIPQVMRILYANGVLHGDALTIDGRTVAEVIKDVPARPSPDQDVIRPWDRPLAPQGHIVIRRGNLAPAGAVAKISGHGWRKAIRSGSRRAAVSFGPTSGSQCSRRDVRNGKNPPRATRPACWRSTPGSCRAAVTEPSPMADTVAIQGEAGSFSHAAALETHGDVIRLMPCVTFVELFRAVQGGAATSGVVPIENTLAGSVHENYDLLS